MDRPECFLTSLLTLFCILLRTAADETIYSCFGQGNKTLEINCGERYMIHIKRSFYGFSATGHCRLMEGEIDAGCVKDDRVSTDCVGRSRCTINLPTGQRGLSIPACGQRSNYLQVYYTCVAADTVHDICKEDRLLDQSGYIKTPRYPLNYQQQGLCSVTVIVQPSQKVRLNIIDMDLKDSSHTSCADFIYFNDKLRSVTLCSSRYNNTYDWLSNFLHIELQSTSGGMSKGFWLYYEAYPPLPNTLPTPETPLASYDASVKEETNDRGDNQDNEDTTPAYSKNTVPLYRNHRNNSNKLPFAAIAGGVIGTLSLILVILLLMLFVKWMKERQYYRAEKILDIRNPAFRSSGDFYEQPNNNEYSHC